MPASFRFGVFELDPDSGELRKHGVRIKLHRQPCQLLQMLVERPGEIVTRDQMRQQLWKEGTFVDFDHGLNAAVNKLREALDDSAGTPRYIETIPGKGYRFVAPVTGTPQPEHQEGAANILTVAEELPAAPRRTVRWLLLAIETAYLGFYIGALANLAEIHQIFLDAGLPPALLLGVLVTTAAALIPVRLFLISATLFEFSRLSEKFRRMFPVLLVLDLLWALSPFLLVHHVNFGLALAMSAALLYLPFAQRSLVLMYCRS